MVLCCSFGLVRRRCLTGPIAERNHLSEHPRNLGAAMKALKNITDVIRACLGTSPKVKADLQGGMVVMVPTYVVLDEKSVRRCSSKLHELIALGHYVRITSRTSRKSLEKALKPKLLKPNIKELEALGIYDRVFL